VTRASLRTQALASRASGQAMLVGPDIVLELLDEIAGHDVAQIRARASEVRGNLPSARRVHVLRGGVTLCGDVRGAPCDWPAGNTWVSVSDAIGVGIVNCLGCRLALELEWKGAR
jgi:hypothetical protein